MRRVALGFLIGMILLQQVSSLPGLLWSWWLVILIPAAIRYVRWRWLMAIGIGFCWANIIGHSAISGTLDPALEGQNLLVSGVIASLPDTGSQRTRFHFMPEAMHRLDASQANKSPELLPGKLLLNWYADTPVLEVGARWQFQVRLKQPHGFMNPGGVDYEAWLFAQGIRATGYVRDQSDQKLNRLLKPPAGAYPVDQFRQTLRRVLNAALAGEKMKGIVLALAIGDRQQISDSQWEILTRTGTSHLVAISGLHVGLVAGFAFFAVQRVWRLSKRATLFWPATKAGALAGLLAATAYALLAGFTIPTQRALVMISVVMLGILLQRCTRPSNLLALALILVLIMDSLSVLAAGFWLSFGAVAIIVYGMQGRPGSEANRWQRGWWRWGRVQWLVALGLLPLMLVLFQQASLVAPLANFVAVPWVSLITVPLTLLGTTTLWVFPDLGEQLLGLAAGSLELLWWFLELLGNWPYAQWEQGVAPLWTIICSLLGIVWLLLPRGIPARWVGIVWLLPLVLFRPESIPHGEAQFSLLDVGQGLAAVVQTHSHVLVFDAGPRFRSGFNTGDAVVAPYLRSRGVTVINTLVVSHGDNDHLGGVTSLVRSIPAQRVLTSVPQKLSALDAETCHAGQSWWWDEVHFEILNPERDISAAASSGNNRSCVLRVSAGEHSVLLTGDIERETEWLLVQKMGAKLASDVVVVPHHGSTTSSSEVFLDAVAARFALFPVGYRNRFGFPKPQVVVRYRARGVRMLDTARYGAIEIRLGRAGTLKEISGFRQDVARYWHHHFPDIDAPAARRASSDGSVSLLQ